MQKPLTDKERAMWEQRHIERASHVASLRDPTRRAEATIAEHSRDPDEEETGPENYADFGI
ncbi:MAG: hypothetical protein ACLSAF_15365 [Intestinimonas sp.]